MTPQEGMKEKLEGLGLPYKEVKCYGSQVMITVLSESAAKRWTSVLAKFATVRPIFPSSDYATVNKNTVMKPSLVKVWRVWATI